MHRMLIGVATLATLALSGSASAGPERIPFPDYKSDAFVTYMVVDRPDNKMARFMYVNKSALEAARSGQPAPDGTIIVMENRSAAVDGEGNPRRDETGRFIATDQVNALFVMQKQAGWGEAFPPDKRNGDWDYAQFQPADGTLRPNTNYENCFNCHMSRAERDFTFTFAKFLLDTKKM